jgi:hypothetical protein
MKYFYRELKSRNGEYEYSHKAVFPAEDKETAEGMVRETARTFWSDTSTEDDGTFYHNGGEVCIEAQTITEISKEEYDVLNKFLP